MVRKIDAMPSTTELSPQERLAVTRKAIVRHMNRDHREDSSDEGSTHVGGKVYLRVGWLGALDNARHAVLVWWHRHPASAIVELARPLLGDYAGIHPLKLLGISAIVGSAIVILKPWRMMSIGSWLVAAVKSSGLTSAVISLLTKPRKKPTTNYSYNNL